MLPVRAPGSVCPVALSPHVGGPSGPCVMGGHPCLWLAAWPPSCVSSYPQKDTSLTGLGSSDDLIFAFDRLCLKFNKHDLNTFCFFLPVSLPHQRFLDFWSFCSEQSILRLYRDCIVSVLEGCGHPGRPVRMSSAACILLLPQNSCSRIKFPLTLILWFPLGDLKCVIHWIRSFQSWKET